MKLNYKNNWLEIFVKSANTLVAMGVAASFVLLFGFRAPLLPASLLWRIQFLFLSWFIMKNSSGFNGKAKTSSRRAGSESHRPGILVLVIPGAGRWLHSSPTFAARASASIWSCRSSGIARTSGYGCGSFWLCRIASVCPHRRRRDCSCCQNQQPSHKPRKRLFTSTSASSQGWS